MTSTAKLRTNLRHWWCWAAWNPIRGRAAVAVGALLMRVGLALLSAGVTAALWFDLWIEGGLRKWAHQHRRSERWNDRAAEVVERARELSTSLKGEISSKWLVANAGRKIGRVRRRVERHA